MVSNKFYYLFLLFIVIQLSSLYLIDVESDKKMQKLLYDESSKIDTQYKSIFKNYEDLANTIFNGYINHPHITQKIANKEREALYNELKEPYKYLKTVNIHQLHFHTKDNISFLRMHKPEKFGDDLSSFRHSINYTNSKKQFSSGLEMGRIVPGFRFVYPLFYMDKHIGSVETSFKVKSFAKKLNELYNVKTTFLLDKEIASSELFKDLKSTYDPSIESDNYVVYKDSTSEKIKKNIHHIKEAFDNGLKDEIKEKIAKKELFSINKKINNFHKIITFLPVSDLENRKIGYFVVYRDSGQLKELYNEFLTIKIFAAITIAGLFFLAFRELRYKDALKEEVKIKTKELNDTAVKLEEQTSELEELNQTLEKKVAYEVERNAKQERELFQQSKQAALGDMIGNIAHQWRQPLSAIASNASGMQLTQYSGLLSGDDIINYTNGIIKNANYLSQTIDDFRDFIKSDKKITRFDVSHAVDKCLDIVNSSINNHNLKILKELPKDITIANYENELQQAVINIFTNAKDALKEKVAKSEDRMVFIRVYQDGITANISIKDTAGGIDDSIMEKIFEPYFTTKHQSQGTGLGLYMTHRIVIESMKGTISVENVTFEHEGKTYNGAEFILSFSLT